MSNQQLHIDLYIKDGFAETVSLIAPTTMNTDQSKASITKRLEVNL